MALVSDRFAAGLATVARERGLPLDALLADMPALRRATADPGGRMEWAEFAEFLDRLGALAGGTPEGLEGLGRDSVRTPAFKGIRLLGIAVAPRHLYTVGARFNGPSLFPCTTSDFELLTDGRFRIQIWLDPAERGCAAFFHCIHGFFEKLPTALGLADSLVEAEITPHHGVYFVTPPPAATLAARLRRIFGVLRGTEAALDELRLHHESLAEQTSALRAARSELAESERRFGAVFHASPLPMIICPVADESLVDANEAFLETAGMRREELVNTSIEDLPIWPADFDVAALRAGLRQREPTRSLPIRFRNRSGELRQGLLSSSPSRFAGRDVALIQVADVTEHAELQKRLLQSQKMEVVGQLAGGVAHDFNNLLTVISGYADQQLGSLAPATPDHEAAQEILRAADRASKLTGQLLAFGRRQILRTRRLDPNETVREMLAMLRRLIPENVTIRSELGEEVGSVSVDRGQLEQVILNLALNARDAVGSGGELRIATRRARREEAEAAEGAGLVDGDYVAIEIADDGSGMDPGLLDRIFEPFFTTKPVGKGTGLGLPTVQGIVIQSGGRLRVDSAPGRGTSVTAFLPRVAAVADEPEPRVLPELPPASRQTLLLVEDEERVRDLLRRQLESAGYRVLTAGCGEEALRVEGAHAGPIHALVSDLVMPRMGGTDLAEALRARRPGIRVLFMSGYPIDQTPDDETPILPKPFRLPELDSAIRSLLRDSRSA